MVKKFKFADYRSELGRRYIRFWLYHFFQDYLKTVKRVQDADFEEVKNITRRVVCAAGERGFLIADELLHYWDLYETDNERF